LKHTKKIKSTMGQNPLVCYWSPIQGPQPDTSRSRKTMDTGLASLVPNYTVGVEDI